MEENPFKKIKKEKDPPELLKKKVMSSVSVASLFVDCIELFTVKMGDTAGEMLPRNSDTNNDENVNPDVS
ncbi:MAG: hypothetical protein RJQ09_20195 [Cyclobacteriaceae bacterium]